VVAVVLPLVAILGVLPAVSGSHDSGIPQGATAAAVASDVQHDLAVIASTATKTAADPGLRQQLAAASDANPLSSATKALASGASAVGPAVVRLALSDASGKVRLTWSAGSVKAGGADKPPATATSGGKTPDLSAAPPFVAPGGDHQAVVVARIPAAGNVKAGTLAVWFSVDELLEGALQAAGAPTGGPDRLAAQFLSANGGLLGDSRTAAGLGDTPAPLDEAASRATDLTATPPFPAWELRVGRVDPPFTPAQSASPLALALPLGILAGLFVAGLWGVTQVLRPAHELSESRVQLERLYNEAVVHAYVDVLTGLGNQRAFQEEFDRELELARRERFPVALLVLDLDDFKRVNDTEGHAAGDELLARFARVLEGCVRRSDRAFRTGGDEFAVVMPGSDVGGAHVVARRILAAALEPEHTGSPHHAISFSGGISATTDHSLSRIELFTQADAALYWSKRHGRTTITIYDSTRHHAEVGESTPELAAAVASVVEQRSLRAVFQPIVELSTGQVIGFEGLVRPTAPPFNDPGSLFAAAEAGGRTIELDRACLETIAVAASVIAPEQYVAINLSPRTLEAPEFNALALCRQLARLGLPAQRIVLELTEREEVEDITRLRRNLEACRALGVRVAADDVGAGNSGLRLLSLVPFDVVKIDLSLVQDAATHQTSAEVLETLRELAQRRGAKVIAEGLETTQQLRTVIAAGIDAAQGYLLGRPGEAVDIGWLDIEALIASDRARHTISPLDRRSSVA